MNDNKEIIETSINELSLLDEIDYDRKRKYRAKELGLSVSFLDRAVAKKRKKPFIIQKDPEAGTDFFTILGHHRGYYFYFSRQKGQIVSLPSSGHTRLSLLELAPEEYWVANYYEERTNDVSIVRIASDLITRSHSVGIFDIKKIRGRGAWWDPKLETTLFHLGDKIYVDGEYHVPGNSNGYIYENSNALADLIDEPMKKEDARKFYDICTLLQWRDKSMGAYLAGYCVVAHIGGALDWRPHIWINGGAGTGKSWIISKIVRPIFGKNCLFVAGNTSEAFIRQELGNDSVPVLFDEAEGNNETSVKRIQHVLELARQSSSQTGAVQGKGTTSGKPMTYSVRSCFGLASINASIVQSADNSRITTLEIMPDKTGRFPELEKMVRDTIDEKYCASFMARAIKLVPVIRKSAKILASSVAIRYGTQRTGDQLGALLAGLWSLQCDDVISSDEADDFVDKYFLSDKKLEDEENNDAARCWTHMVQSLIDVRFPNGHEKISVGEIIDIAMAKKGRGDFTETQAEDLLVRYGIKVDRLGITISNSHPELKKIFSSTPYAAAWTTVMRRIEGSKATDNMSFGSRHMKSRGVFVPHE